MEKALKEVGESGAQIFEVHQMMLEDDDYNDSVKSIIGKLDGKCRICRRNNGR